MFTTQCTRMCKISDKMDHVGGVALVFLLSFSCAYLASVDVFPEGRVVVNKGEEFQIICKNLSPANSWYSLQYVIQVSNVIIPFAFSWKNMTPCNKRMSSNDILGNMSFSCNYTVFVLTVFKASLKANNVLIGCFIYVDDRDDSSNYTTIKIKEPLNEPDVAPSGKQIITENLSTTFQCSARSYPAPEIFWFIYDRRLLTSTLLKNTNFSSSTLTYKANRVDNGRYLYCTASNEYESANSSMIMLEIRYIPNIHMEPIYNPYIVYHNQRDVVLTCVIDDPKPSKAVTYEWNSPSGTVNTQNLTIPAVTKLHSGQYSCTATNIAGTSNKATKQLHVHYGPIISNISNQHDITEGNNLIVSPIVDANPVSTLVWWTKMNNADFRYDGVVLRINNINRGSSGNYSCYVMNTMSPSGMSEVNRSTHQTFSVNVLFKPFLDSSKPYSPRHVTAAINSTLRLILTIIANPEPTIEWTFRADKDWNSCNFVTIVSNTTSDEFFTSSSVLINNVNSYNFGDYVFTARNTAGVFSRRFVAMEESLLRQEMFASTKENTGMFLAGIVTLVFGLLSLMASVVFVVRNSLKNKTINSSKTDQYSDVQRSNPAFTDAYTTLQSGIETRAPQDQTTNYEECGRTTEAHAYSSVDNIESEPTQLQQHGVNTYEECGKRIEAHAYDTLNN